MAAAGFHLSARTPAGAQAGTLAAPPGATAVKVETAAGVHYAGHTEPGSRLAAPGAAEWQVVWTAPTSGSVTFSAAANAAADDRSPMGDYVYTLQRTAGPHGSEHRRLAYARCFALPRAACSAVT